MKFIWKWKWNFEDREKETELYEKIAKGMEENPDDWPKMLTPTCFTGRGKGFRLIEADNEEQLMRLVTAWAPTESYSLEPYLEAGEKWSKIIGEVSSRYWS
tara:strand:+ start:144 stop:446 length:303 start_codon:yes stop_codon:yes gene_type:complete